MKLTLELDGLAAETLWRELLYQYALLVLKSRVEPVCTSAPWFSPKYAKGRTALGAYARWMHEVDSDRVDYRKALLAFYPNGIPEVPFVKFNRSRDKPDKWLYSFSTLKDAATAYAKEHLPPVEVAKKALGLK